jgi:hypothetical protein
MPDMVRSFNPQGMAVFSKWLKTSTKGSVPHDLLIDQAYSKPLCESDLLSNRRFKDRYEFGSQLVQMLQPLPSQEISYDQGLWTWLAAWYFDQICPPDAEGKRTLRNEYVYVLTVPRIYYRHLVRTPWFLVSRHGEACRFLLASTAGDRAPLSRQSYLLDQLAARQFVITSPTLIAAASRLYTDQKTGRVKRGAGAKGRGSPRRLALIANQLSLTYDIREMPIENFMKLLPDEFSQRW